MKLILWRHAEDGVPDAARRLASKGFKQAESMVGYLNQDCQKNTRIIVSPVKRAQQTAMTLGRFLATNQESCFGCNSRNGSCRC